MQAAPAQARELDGDIIALLPVSATPFVSYRMYFSASRVPSVYRYCHFGEVRHDDPPPTSARDVSLRLSLGWRRSRRRSQPAFPAFPRQPATCPFPERVSLASSPGTHFRIYTAADQRPRCLQAEFQRCRIAPSLSHAQCLQPAVSCLTLPAPPQVFTVRRILCFTATTRFWRINHFTTRGSCCRTAAITGRMARRPRNASGCASPE